ncbi:MAG TPA: hypothetical protein VEG08_08230 [Terriglobales bacterium]|nr:hypothetical protein [Terriglobales bacterium]
MSQAQLCRFATIAALLLLCLGGVAHAQGPITGVSVTASPQGYRGVCPVHIRFTGLVYVDRYPMVFNYHWERSDGASTPLRMYRVNNPRQRVVRLVEDWQLGGYGQSRQVWMRLAVNSGNTHLVSEAATIHFTCR